MVDLDLYMTEYRYKRQLRLGKKDRFNSILDKIAEVSKKIDILKTTEVIDERVSLQDTITKTKLKPKESKKPIIDDDWFDGYQKSIFLTTYITSLMGSLVRFYSQTSISIYVGKLTKNVWKMVINKSRFQGSKFESYRTACACPFNKIQLSYPACIPVYNLTLMLFRHIFFIHTRFP